MSRIVYAQRGPDRRLRPIEVVDAGQGFTTWWLEGQACEVAHPPGALAAYAAEEAERAALLAGPNPPDPASLEPTSFARFGIQALTLPPAPAGQQLASYQFSAAGDGTFGVAATFAAVPLADLKTQATQAVTDIYLAKTQAGFPAPSLGAGESLQCRDTTDECRWLGFRGRCKELVDAGHGSDPAPLPVRSTSNTDHTVTNAAGLALMDALMDWAGALLVALWAKKSAIAAAADAAAVAAIDPTTGWPG